MTQTRIIATDENIHEIVKSEIERLGIHADLNHIDVSQVTFMRALFAKSQFNGDISRWDVAKVENMEHMFVDSQFNGDISRWDVSKVERMAYVFNSSAFNGDISNWDVSKVKDMSWMFNRSEFNGDISNWDVSKVERMEGMFDSSNFSGDLSKWNVGAGCFAGNVLKGSPALTDPNFCRLHFMTKVHNEALTLHPDAEAAYAESMSIIKVMYPDGPLKVHGVMAWEVYRASKFKGATDSYDYTAALDACDDALNA